MRPAQRIISAAALGALALAAPAAADQRITASPSDTYSTPNVTMAQGERLTFANFDLDSHNVTSRATGSSGQPLFSTPTIGPAQERFVDGSQYLTSGTYAFFCTVHPYMTGMLTVSGGSTPAPPPPPPPPPPSPADTTPPKLSVSIPFKRLSSVRSSRRLTVSASVNEAATVTLTATVRSGRKTVTLAQGSASFSAAGARSITLTLRRAGRLALQGRRSATVTLTARAKDGAGNPTSKSAQRTLRR